MAAAAAGRQPLPVPWAGRRRGLAALGPRGRSGGRRRRRRRRRKAGGSSMWPPPPPSPPAWLLAGLVLAARCGEALGGAAGASATSASPRPTEAAGGGGATRGGSGRLAEVSAPPEQGQPMTQRALSVLVLASAALIVYFVIRTVRLRRHNRKTRRYGVLDTNIENMELTPLEQDDDDDDTTLFDANHPRR
ncbi:membrane protein FAM174A [Cygnus atratus]|uniref:membrane protein FAM174A n=1 Tax=Cygnus atratus TaxID=8868 RepID=UPI0021B79454|nr:membrane protein FAM174A [Cygnus atratus]